MKNYMAIFLGVPSSPKFAEFMAMEEGKRKKVEATGLKAWGDWMQKHQSVIVQNRRAIGKNQTKHPHRVYRTPRTICRASWS